MKGLLIFGVAIVLLWVPLRHKTIPEVPWVTVVSMVRNESHILPRFLKSVQTLTPHVVFCDTGSTDGTLEMLSEYPLIQYEWTGRFDTSRNKCLADALKRVKTPYVLLLDADHTLFVYEKTKKPDHQVNTLDLGGYRLPYLVASDTLRENCTYKGVTHEYLDCGTSTQGAHYGIAVGHHGDGGTRSTKFTRDLELLKTGYKEEGDPTLRIRYAFYLARTYESLGEWKDAQEWYKKRAEWGGWQEEVWYSTYKQGYVLLEQNKTDDGRQILLNAYGMNPHRAEPLYYLAMMYRLQKRWSHCLLYARAGLLVGTPDVNALFVDQAIYKWGLDDEQALCLFYSGRPIEARGHWKRMLKHELPLETYERVQANLY